MTNAQRLAIRCSEIRQRLNEIAGLEGDDFTDAIRQESDRLTGELTDKETQYRAALAAGDGTETVDAEDRERRGLAGRARVGAFIRAAVEQRGIDGAEADLASAYECPGMLPLALFDVERPTVERRAVTPGVTADQEQAAPTVPFAFERSAAAALGFQFPMVGPGQANYPVVTTGAPSGSVEKGGSALKTAAAFRLDVRTPKRISGQFEIRVEDMAVFPDMERALRESLMDSSANALDEGAFAGDNANGALNGLFNQATDVAIAGAEETFATGIARFAALVDGQYAYSWRDIRAVIGSATFAKYAALFEANGGSDGSLFDYLAGKLGALRVSNRVPDVAATGQKAIVTLTGTMQPLRIPTWMGIELIVDPYTQAGKGVKVVTATMLVGDPHVPYSTSQLIELHPRLS